MADRDPEYIARWLGENLHKMDNPAQMLGTEPGAARKPWDSVDVRWLIAASWPYYHSTGNQSIPAVCATINRNDGFYADRFYLPETPRDLRQLERAGIPVFGIESKHQLRDFDVVGTSISYAVLWMNFCKMLKLSGVPLRWRDREADPGAYPMVIAGGQACRGPGFMEPAADCIFLGEVEDEPGNGGLSQVCARIAAFKVDESWRYDRLGCYAALAREFNYLLFPRFVQTFYRYEDRGLPEPSKQVSGYASLLDGMRMPFRARTVKNLDDIDPLTEAPLLYADPRMGAGDIEVGRGCDAWCSFCALGWNANPPRERSVGKSVEHAKAWQRNMGSTELSPFSPDFPMHRQKKRLLAALLKDVNSSLDVTAMRIDDFIEDDQYMLIQARAGADGVTLGLEGNSQRMRDLVGKGVADKDVEEAVTRGIRAGFRKFKLFMITNFPGEEPGDVMKIVELGRRLAAIRDELGQPHVVFQFSWTPLLIESQTPFQWFAPTPPDHILIKVAEEFRELGIQFKIGDLDHREPVLTPDRGFVPIGQLEVGDLVVDPQGEPSKVTGVFPMGVNKTFRVTWSDGASVLATGNHPWDVLRKWDNRNYTKRTLTTYQLQQLRERRVPTYLVRSPGLADQDLGSGEGVGLDPYLLGLLLGDGCLTKRVPQFASADPELFDAVCAVLPAGVGLTYDSTGCGGCVATYNLSQADGGGRCYPRRENPVTGELRRLGQWHHKAHEKFVPDSYKWAPAAVRLAVLQGLMDTDGTVGPDGRSAIFSSASRQLRDDVTWLARSLGLAAKDAEWDSYVTEPGGSRKPARRAYRSSVWPTAEVPVFRLARKQERMDPIALLRRRLASVEQEGETETVCISVSAASEEYIAGTGLVPTHNTKAEVNKVSLFQLCQRASREAGEAITDVIGELDTACWGGVPKDTRDRLEAALRRRGFRNGLADCFDERFAGDLFGWEYIDMGVSFERMWDAYRQMTEFLEGTDAETYESQFAGPAGGNEWVARCDQQCGGQSCGVCDGEDLKLRAGRIRAEDADIDLARIKVIDQDSVAFKIRARISVPPENRFVTREHWKYAVRRAAYRAQHDVDWKTGIAKKTVHLASEACKHSDWACGTDYAEFGLTWRPPADELHAFMDNVTAELAPWLTVGDWSVYPAAADVRRDAGLALWELEPPAGPDEVSARLAWFAEQDYVKLVIRSDSAYFGSGTEEVNAKDWVSDLWLARGSDKESHASKLRMLISAKAGPYALYAALAGKPSWIAAAAKPAVRLGIFAPAGDGDLLRPPCDCCGEVIPVGLLDEPYDLEGCPRCADEAAGIVTAGLRVMAPRLQSRAARPYNRRGPGSFPNSVPTGRGLRCPLGAGSQAGGLSGESSGSPG